MDITLEKIEVLPKKDVLEQFSYRSMPTFTNTHEK